MGERLNGIQEVRGSTPLISTKSKTDCVSSPFCFWWKYVNERFCASCMRTKKLLFCSDQRERIATCPAHPKDGVWVQTPLISTIVEPVKPNGLAGFSLCPQVSRINDMSARCGQNLPLMQTEIPTGSPKRPVGILFREGQFMSKVTTSFW